MRRSDDSHHFCGFPETRRVFLSYSRKNLRAVKEFVERWSCERRVFGYLGVGVLPGDPPTMESEDPD